MTQFLHSYGSCNGDNTTCIVAVHCLFVTSARIQQLKAVCCAKYPRAVGKRMDMFRYKATIVHSGPARSNSTFSFWRIPSSTLSARTAGLGAQIARLGMILEYGVILMM